MLGQSEKLCHYEVDKLGSIFRLAVLNDMLRDVVAVLISYENLRRGVKLSHDFGFIGIGSVLEHSLDDTASVGVRSKARNLTTHGIHDVINVLPGYQLDDLLDDMIAVLVPNDT